MQTPEARECIEARKKPQDKVLNEDVLVDVKPLEPWPDPPLKKGYTRNLPKNLRVNS